MLKAKYTTGSQCFLNNVNDKDEVWFYETKEEATEARRKRGLDRTINVHYDYVRPLTIFLGCYIYHFMELLEGDDLHLNEFSIFDHKDEYIELLKHYVKWLPREDKHWYHILTVCYMFANESYELTDKQLEAIQHTHDKGITDAKYDYCLKQLGVV